MRYSPRKPENAMSCWSAKPQQHPWENKVIVCGYAKKLENERCRGCVKINGVFPSYVVIDEIQKRIQRRWADRWS